MQQQQQQQQQYLLCSQIYLELEIEGKVPPPRSVESWSCWKKQILPWTTACLSHSLSLSLSLSLSRSRSLSLLLPLSSFIQICQISAFSIPCGKTFRVCGMGGVRKLKIAEAWLAMPCWKRQFLFEFSNQAELSLALYLNGETMKTSSTFFTSAFAQFLKSVEA